MNPCTVVLPLIFIAATSFSGLSNASPVENADAHAQAVAMLRGARVTTPANVTKSAASERVITDGQGQAVALLRGQAIVSAPGSPQPKSGSARLTGDAHSHAAALLRGSRPL